MGLWWRRAEPFRMPRGEGVSFEGIYGLSSKRIPLLWRVWWPYYVLKVTGFQNSYELEFISGGAHMVFRRRITTRYVAVRIGPDPVQFWAHQYGLRWLRRCPIEKTTIRGSRSSIKSRMAGCVTFA